MNYKLAKIKTIEELIEESFGERIINVLEEDEKTIEELIEEIWQPEKYGTTII